MSPRRFFDVLPGDATPFEQARASPALSRVPGDPLLVASSGVVPARTHMGSSLGFHIIFDCFGIAFPAIILVANRLGIRRRDPVAMLLARRWSKVGAVIFAVGAVSGTVLSYELGLLWPTLMGRFGAAYGIPFSIEGVWFFIEPISMAIYLYGWSRLPVIFNRAMPYEVLHMIMAAFMVVGFVVACVYAVGMLRGRTDRYHQLGFRIPFTMAAVITPVQIVFGDTVARAVARQQPQKFAAMDLVDHTQRGATEWIGGIYYDGKVLRRRTAQGRLDLRGLLPAHHDHRLARGTGSRPHSNAQSGASGIRHDGGHRHGTAGVGCLAAVDLVLPPARPADAMVPGPGNLRRDRARWRSEDPADEDAEQSPYAPVAQREPTA